MIPEPAMPEGAAARMHVKGVKRTAGEPGVLVMLETVPDEHTLGLLMPAGEADRVARVLGLTPCSCLPIYGLVAEILGHSGGVIRHALLDAHADGVAPAEFEITPPEN